MTNPLNSELVRIRLVALAMFGGLLFLAGVLGQEQILRADRYRSNESRQSLRRVRLPAVRGLVLDRYGRCVARNRPSYCLAIYAEELRQPGRRERTVERMDGVVERLAGVLRLPRETSPEQIRMHLRKRMPIPLLAWRGIGEDALARWAESGVVEPGVDVYVEPVREYPYGRTLCHVLGYVGAEEPTEEDAEEYHYYVPQMQGKGGIEKSLNAVLAGEAGGKLIRVDASGFKYDETAEKMPREGRAVALTIDLDFQQLAESVLGTDRGALVVMDPRNGDVLALASSPGFDPNAFTRGMAADDWRALLSDADKPLLNRAVGGVYPPGSTFKPVVALAALASGRASAATEFDCPGYFELGTVRFSCWNTWGHGRVAMRKAIEQSCNAYFCQLGLGCTYQRIERAAADVGFGRRTGIELPAEAAGLLPSDAWKRRAMHDGWRAGDTCNASIGQGFLSVTPLQVAAFMCALANGGFVYKPRIVLGATPGGVLVSHVEWSREALDVVRSGMYDVVQSPTGTGRHAQVDGLEMAGKTGTAEYGVKGQGRKHTWMAVFAPYANPRFAVAMVVEEGVSGGRTVAPRIKELMTGILQVEADRALRAGAKASVN